MIKLSHSGRGKFDHCGEMYNLHYIQKIRPAGTTSSLLFGSAIDKAAEHYLLGAERSQAEFTFIETWQKQEINGTLTNLQNHSTFEFHPNDFDHELLLESDNELILEGTVYETVSALVEAGENKERIHLANWFSLYRKGLIIINSFMNWVDEKVEEVLDVQCEIELEDENGDEITGKADFVLKMKGYDVPVLVDLKTAARYYERDSVKKSEQLATYFFYLKNTKYPEMKRCAYLVLSKQIKKNRVKTCKKCGAVTEGREAKCAAETEGEIILKGKNKGKPKKERCNGEFDVVINPEANIQFIHDEISEKMIEDTMAKFADAISRINSGDLEPNYEGCDSYYGRRCPYYNYCHNDRDMTGLIKKEEKNE
jgi:rubrerythrin